MTDIHVKKARTKFFYCARESRAVSSERSAGRGQGVFVQVEAFSKDHAIERLMAEYPFIEKSDWEILDESEKFDHEGNEFHIGFFGTKLPLTTQ